MRAHGSAQRISAACCICKANTQLHVRLDPPRRPVEHRPHFMLALLHAAEAGLNDPSAFVSQGYVLGRQRIVVGDHHELVAELLSRLHLARIQLWPSASVGAEIAAVPARGYQPAGCLGVIDIPLVEQRDDHLEFGQDLLVVLTLAFGLSRVHAQHVAPAPLALPTRS